MQAREAYESPTLTQLGEMSQLTEHHCHGMQGGKGSPGPQQWDPCFALVGGACGRQGGALS